MSVCQEYGARALPQPWASWGRRKGEKEVKEDFGKAGGRCVLLNRPAFTRLPASGASADIRFLPSCPGSSLGSASPVSHRDHCQTPLPAQAPASLPQPQPTDHIGFVKPGCVLFLHWWGPISRIKSKVHSLCGTEGRVWSRLCCLSCLSFLSQSHTRSLLLSVLGTTLVASGRNPAHTSLT